VWLVPSQSGKGGYTVWPHERTPRCTCPDREEGSKCKHIFAVKETIQHHGVHTGFLIRMSLGRRVGHIHG
jgi:uncharacterized Zn finger protein